MAGRLFKSIFGQQVRLLPRRLMPVPIVRHSSAFIPSVPSQPSINVCDYMYSNGLTIIIDDYITHAVATEVIDQLIHMTGNVNVIIENPQDPDGGDQGNQPPGPPGDQTPPRQQGSPRQQASPGSPQSPINKSDVLTPDKIPASPIKRATPTDSEEVGKPELPPAFAPPGAAGAPGTLSAPHTPCAPAMPGSPLNFPTPPQSGGQTFSLVQAALQNNVPPAIVPAGYEDPNRIAAGLPIGVGSVWTATGEFVVMQEMPTRQSAKVIRILLNCPGGEISPILAIHDAMKNVQRSYPIATCCIGEAEGLSSLLLAAGSKEYRYATPNSRIKLQSLEMESLKETACRLSRLLNMGNFEERRSEMVKALYKNYCSPQSHGFIDDIWENDIQHFISAREANTRGIVDHVQFLYR